MNTQRNNRRFEAVTTLLLVGLLAASANASASEWSRPDFVAFLNAEQTVPNEPNEATGIALFKFNRNNTKLRYTIYVYDLDLDGFVTPEEPGDDVTKIHFHNAPPGVAGPHILNVFKLPRQDDEDLVIKPFAGKLGGVWDDGDENLEGAPSLKLSDSIETLCSGNAYVNVHSVDHAPGVIRGQIEPTSRVCRRLVRP